MQKCVRKIFIKVIHPLTQLKDEGTEKVTATVFWYSRKIILIDCHQTGKIIT